MSNPINREHEQEKRIGMETMLRASKLERASIIAKHYVRFASYMLAIERMIQTHRQTPQPFKATPGSLLSLNIEAICDNAFSDIAKDFRLTFGIDLPHYQFTTDPQPTPAQPVPPTTQPVDSSHPTTRFKDHYRPL